MPHKTLINNTNYKINTGISRVSGTNYKINAGKSIIEGTTFNIYFTTTWNKYSVTKVKTDWSSETYSINPKQVITLSENDYEGEFVISTSEYIRFNSNNGTYYLPSISGVQPPQDKYEGTRLRDGYGYAQITLPNFYFGPYFYADHDDPPTCDFPTSYQVYTCISTPITLSVSFSYSDRLTLKNTGTKIQQYYYRTAKEIEAAGFFMGQVTSTDPNKYPINGKHTDGYWYVRV